MSTFMRASGSAVVIATLLAACGGRVVVDAQGTGAGGATNEPTTTSSTGASSSTTASSSASSSGVSSSSVSSSSSASSSGAVEGLVELALLNSPYAVAVDAEYAYVSEGWGGRVVKIPKTGGAPIKLGEMSNPAFLALDDNRVYVTASLPSGSQVVAVPKAGGTATAISELDEVCSGLATDATRVYCSGYNKAAIRALDKTSVSGTSLCSTPNVPRGVFVDGDFIYWGAEEGATVGRVPKGGGAPTILAKSMELGGWNVAVDATHVYWSGMTGNGITVKSIPKAGGGTPTVIATEPTPGIVTVAVDDEHIYWANGNAGTVSAIPKGGGPVTVIGKNQGNVYSIAADNSAVYWVSNTTERLMRFTW
ncbi:Hypothetical protein A7982_03096 [Minicystis rosea]|nr:Hypothetical protein A7982_03096 [Minicystis rosea]